MDDNIACKFIFNRIMIFQSLMEEGQKGILSWPIMARPILENL